jgi:pSer/pThr/pTyr-binding forkhead associated (FHA) protein
MANLPLETLSEVDPAIEREAGPPQPHLFRVFECNHPLAPSARHCLGDVDEVVVGRGERRCERGARARQLNLHVPDPWASSAHAHLVRRDGGWLIEDTGSRNGTLLNGAPVERAELADGDIFEIGRTFFVFRQAETSSTADPADLESSVLAPAVAERAPTLTFEKGAARAKSQAITNPTTCRPSATP